MPQGAFVVRRVTVAVAIVAFIIGCGALAITSRTHELRRESGDAATVKYVPAAESPPRETPITWSAAVNRVADRLRQRSRDTIEEFWKVRMLALVELARLGPEAALPVAELLRDGEPSVRALACEALGMLGDPGVSKVLERALVFDPDSQVRLYAARSLGQLGTMRSTPEIQKAIDHDDVYDVRTHAEMALTQRDAKDDGEIRRALAGFDPSALDSAGVDRPAPDFTLRDLDGKSHSLSDYRGKQPVVLVFLVGDVCPYCPGQIAQLRRQKRRIEELGAAVLMIEPHERFRLKSTVKLAGGSVPSNFPILADPAQTVSAAYGVAMHARAHTEWSNRPASFVIDRSGIIRLAHRDPPDHRIDPEDLIQVLRLVNHLDRVASAPRERQGHGANGY